MKNYDYDSLINISFDGDKNKIKEVAIDVFFDKYDIKDKYNSKEDYEKMKLNVIGLMSKYTTNGSLYKYRSGQKDYDIENIKSDKLTLNDPNNFNDPFEFLIIYNEFEDYPDNWNDILGELPVRLKSQWRVGCLADTNKNQLMWSHYANNHEGFCLEYDLYELFDIGELLLPVKYEGEIVKGSINSGLSQEFMFRKSNVWEYEGEWRIVKQVNDDKSYIDIDAPKVKAIYMGCKINNELKEKLIEICKRREIKLFESKICLNKYDIIFKEILF